VPAFKFRGFSIFCRAMLLKLGNELPCRANVLRWECPFFRRQGRLFFKDPRTSRCSATRLLRCQRNTQDRMSSTMTKRHSVAPKLASPVNVQISSLPQVFSIGLASRSVGGRRPLSHASSGCSSRRLRVFVFAFRWSMVGQILALGGNMVGQMLGVVPYAPDEAGCPSRLPW
jgi:hypothetical protein